MALNPNLGPEEDPAKGWLVSTRFGPGGKRWSGSGPALQVVAINLERGTGSQEEARLNLLKRAVNIIQVDGPLVILTPAGFFGCETLRGDRCKPEIDLKWNPIQSVTSLADSIGDAIAEFSDHVILGVGVDKAGDTHSQEQWWFRGGKRTPERELIRGRCESMAERTFQVGPFKILSFICGELWDGGSVFTVDQHLAGIDVVLDLAHASVNRTWDSTKRQKYRWPFQRAFFDLKDKCGGMLAFAHDLDTTPPSCEYVLRKENWIVFHQEFPFPIDGYEVLRLD